MKNFAKLLALSPVLLATPTLAADLTPDMGAVKQPSGAIVSGTTTLSLESGPEFYALSRGKNVAGNYADTYIKGGISHTFVNNWVLGGSFQATIKSNETYQYYGEATGGYKFKFGAFTLTPQAGLGETWDATGLGTSGDEAAFYYVLYLAGDWKINPQWTWNAFNLRYRNAFDYTWITPKVSTGVSFAIDPNNTMSANVGYSWKDTGSGLIGDKVNVGFAFKHNI